MEIKFLNPKVKDFLKDYEDVTMLGMMWALYWRWLIFVWLILGVLILISFI